SLMALPISGGTPITVAATARDGRFSPDGAWVTYQSTETAGLNEIFVQPFPGSISARKRISNGTLPQWSRDGSRIYFLSDDNHVMALPVRRSEDGRNIVPGPMESLFAVP